MPHNLICTYFEIARLVNGAGHRRVGAKRRGYWRRANCRASAFVVCAKKYMRDLILNNEEYTRRAMGPDSRLQSSEDVIDEMPAAGNDSALDRCSGRTVSWPLRYFSRGDGSVRHPNIGADT